MSFTRKSLADHLDSYDDEITELQNSKREMLNDYRAQLAGLGWGKQEIKSEIEGLKVAMRRRRAIKKVGDEAVEEADAIADEIFEEITRVARGARVHGNIEKFDANTGEILDDPRSDSGLNIVTKHEDITAAPETAQELSRPAPLAVSGGEPSIPSPDAGGVKMDDSEHPGRSDDMSVHKSAQSGQATTDHKPVSYRPNCQHPENCASGTRDHCWSCRRAMALKEEAA